MSDSGHTYPDHAHDHYTIGLMEAGGAFCRAPIRDESLITPGRISLVNPGQVHSGIPLKEIYTFRRFHLSRELVERIGAEVGAGSGGRPLFGRMAVADERACRKLLRLSRLVVDRAEPLAKESALVEALTEILLHHGRPRKDIPDPGREHWAVCQIKEYLRNNLAHRVGLRELARLTGLSRYHLIRVFKKDTGLSPHAFHLQRRVEAGQELLRRGWPILDTALETGFSDQSHFSNTFRKILGATPGQYLRA